MSITRTGENPTADAKAHAHRQRVLLADLKAALSMVRLHDHATTAKAWNDIRVALSGLRQISFFSNDELSILDTFPPEVPGILLRRDTGLWEATIYFLSGQDGWVVSYGDNIQFAVFRTDSEFLSKTYQDTPDRRNIIARLSAAAGTEEACRIGSRTLLALWVARAYDTLQRIAQIRQIHQNLGPDFRPTLVIHEVGNLFDPQDILPFSAEVIKVKDTGAWRLDFKLDENLCECLKFDWKNQNRFHQEMINFIRGCASGSAETSPDIFTLFISIEAEKRRMVNQEEFFFRIISEVSRLRGRTRVLLNGMTGNAEGVDFFKDIGEFEKSILQRLSEKIPSVDFVHMHNWTMLDKIKACRSVDFFVSPIGTAALVPQTLDIPGVVYNSPVMMRQIKWFLDVMPSRAIMLPETLSFPEQEDLAMRKYSWGWADNTRTSYRLDLDKAVDFCMAYLQEQCPIPAADN